MLDQLLAGYAAPEGRFDELLAAPGRPRAHWDAFVRALAERSEREVSDTLSLTERQIREHGITYNVYADAQGAQPAVGGRSDSARAAGRRVGDASPPASSSAPTCSTASSAISTARRRC